MIDYKKIPEHMMLSMKEYVQRGKPMGHFLTALFANDLKAAVSRADDNTITIIREYVSWVHWESPAGCNGSYEVVEAWSKVRPDEDGSALCESGSIASGGKRAYCTCDICF